MSWKQLFEGPKLVKTMEDIEKGDLLIWKSNYGPNINGYGIIKNIDVDNMNIIWEFTKKEAIDSYKNKDKNNYSYLSNWEHVIITNLRKEWMLGN